MDSCRTIHVKSAKLTCKVGQLYTLKSQTKHVKIANFSAYVLRPDNKESNSLCIKIIENLQNPTFYSTFSIKQKLPKNVQTALRLVLRKTEKQNRNAPPHPMQRVASGEFACYLWNIKMSSWTSWQRITLCQEVQSRR